MDPRTIPSSSTFTSDCPLLHERRHLLPYLRPEQYYREQPRAATEATVPAVQHLRRLVLPARRLLPETVLVEYGKTSGKSERQTAQPPPGDGDPPAFAGNAVCACLDGSVVHAHGKGLGEVALRPVSRGDGRRVAIWRLPDRARVRQLAVAEPRGGGGSALVAARLACEVHFAAAATEGGASGGRELREVARTRFPARAHHVCMSPCIRGEAAVLVAGGGLQLLRLERAASSSAAGCGASSSASAAAGGAAAAPLQSVPLPWQAEGGAEAEGCWAAAEYAEHPRCLYAAHGATLWRADLRSPSAPSRLFQLDAMHQQYSDALDRPLLHAADRLCGLAVPRGGMAGPLLGCVSAASLLLLDTRSLACPVQQWRA